MKEHENIERLPELRLAIGAAKYYTPEIGVSVTKALFTVNFCRQYGSGKVDVIPMSEPMTIAETIEYLHNVVRLGGVKPNV